MLVSDRPVNDDDDDDDNNDTVDEMSDSNIKRRKRRTSRRDASTDDTVMQVGPMEWIACDAWVMGLQALTTLSCR